MLEKDLKQPAEPFKVTIPMLQRIRATIEKGWCRGELARDKKWAKVDITSPEACTWCAEGAIALECMRERSAVWNKYCDAVCLALRPFIPDIFKNRGLFRYNDSTTTTKEDILALFDKAINQLEQDQKDVNSNNERIPNEGAS